MKKVLFVALFVFSFVLLAGFFAFFPSKKFFPPQPVSYTETELPNQASQFPQREDVVQVFDYEAMRKQFKGKDVTRVPTEEKLIALTFDGGGNADGTESILKTLAETNSTSTFFLTGRFITKSPESVSAIVRAGHEIANHTVTHRNFKELDEAETAREIESDYPFVPFFRFPYGEYKKGDIELVNEKGYIAVRWTVDSWGWQGMAAEGRDAQFIARRVIEKAVPGAIVLMHLGSAQDKSTLDADALPEVIRMLSGEGYRFVTLSELFNTSLTQTH